LRLRSFAIGFLKSSLIFEVAKTRSVADKNPQAGGKTITVILKLGGMGDFPSSSLESFVAFEAGLGTGEKIESWKAPLRVSKRSHN